jgi:glycosyltransferase involved in cell wall biosynthesis
MISVIIPVYNAQKYLDRCLKSILNQTYNELEILLINDGSTDSSGEICRKYAKNDSRIAYFEKENEGPGATRFFGAQKANGEYICFVDSDDYLAENAIEVLLHSFSDDVDCTIGQHKRFGSVENIKQFSCPIGTFDFQSNDKKLFVDSFLKNTFGGELWNKLFRTSVVKNACCDTIGFPFGEDTFYLISIFSNCRKVVCVDEITYYYEFRSDSLARRTSYDLMLPFFAAECVRLEKTAMCGISDEIYSLISLYMLMLALVKYSRADGENKQRLARDFKAVSRMERIQYFTHIFLKNKNYLRRIYYIDKDQCAYFYCICKTIANDDLWYYNTLYPAIICNRITVFKTVLKRILKKH